MARGERDSKINIWKRPKTEKRLEATHTPDIQGVHVIDRECVRKSHCLQMPRQAAWSVPYVKPRRGRASSLRQLMLSLLIFFKVICSFLIRYMSVCNYECMSLGRSEEGVGSPRAGVAGNCEPPGMDARNGRYTHTLASSKYSKPMSRLSGPL